jgi:hypothetical protein
MSVKMLRSKLESVLNENVQEQGHNDGIEKLGRELDKTLDST